MKKFSLAVAIVLASVFGFSTLRAEVTEKKEDAKAAVTEETGTPVKAEKAVEKTDEKQAKVVTDGKEVKKEEKKADEKKEEVIPAQEAK